MEMPKPKSKNQLMSSAKPPFTSSEKPGRSSASGMSMPVATSRWPSGSSNWMESAFFGRSCPMIQTPRSVPALSYQWMRMSSAVIRPSWLPSSSMPALSGPSRPNSESRMIRMVEPLADSLCRRSASRPTRMSCAKLPTVASLLPMKGIDWLRLSPSLSWTKPSASSRPSRMRLGLFSTPSSEKSLTMSWTICFTSGTLTFSTLPRLALPAATSISAFTPPDAVEIVRSPTFMSKPASSTRSGRSTPKAPSSS